MANQILRTIYINSDVLLIPESNIAGNPAAAAPGIWTGFGGSSAYVALVQSANFSLNIPRADVNAFGYDGVLDRPQLEAETATLEFSYIVQDASTGTAGTLHEGLTGAMLMDLITESKAQSPDYMHVQAEGVGALKTSLMNSFSGEVSVGALATATCGFTGALDDQDNIQSTSGADSPDAAGDPTVVGFTPDEAGADAANVAQIPGGGVADVGTVFSGGAFRTAGGLVMTPASVLLHADPDTPISNLFTVQLLDEAMEPTDGGAQIAPADADSVIESCAQSASFTWDMPVEVVLCLGSNPTTDGLALGNPPGSSSITVEALSAQLSHRRIAYNYTLMFGNLHIAILAANIDSRTHNLAVGDLYGTYNYVLSSTGDSVEIA